MWKYYAILSALFAALTAIFAKLGVRDINANLAIAIRTCVILLITWGIVVATGAGEGIRSLTRNNWTFLVLSGVTTGLSWLFYFKALHLGDASKVTPVDKLSIVFTIALSFIILKEEVTWRVVVGGALVACGALVILMGK